jgi:hypothetical protein
MNTHTLTHTHTQHLFSCATNCHKLPLLPACLPARLPACPLSPLTCHNSSPSGSYADSSPWLFKMTARPAVRSEVHVTCNEHSAVLPAVQALQSTKLQRGRDTVPLALAAGTQSRVVTISCRAPLARHPQATASTPKAIKAIQPNTGPQAHQHPTHPTTNTHPSAPGRPGSCRACPAAAGRWEEPPAAGGGGGGY